MTTQEIIDFYVKRGLTTDMDIMTELDGYVGILQPVYTPGEYVQTQHFPLEIIQLNIPKPNFLKRELVFVC